MITKSERYREIVAVLARHGIGVVDDQLIKHEAGDRFLKGAGGPALGGVAAAGVDVAPAMAQAEELRIEHAKTVPSVCPYCSIGSATLVDTVGNKIINIEGNQPVRARIEGSRRESRHREKGREFASSLPEEGDAQ